MRVLHVLSPSTPEGERAAASVIAEQREHGYVVSVTRVEVCEPSREWCSEAAAGSRGRECGPGRAPLDIVHAHGTGALAAASTFAAASDPRAALVVSLHGWASGDSVPTDAHEAALARADLVAVPTEPAAVRASRLGVRPRRLRVIPYAVTAEAERRSEEEEEEEEEGPLGRELTTWRTQGGDVLCAVSGGPAGDRAPHHEIVLTALSYLAQAEGLLCVLAGQVDAEVCRRMSTALGLAGRVRLSAAPASARRIAARSDYLILPGFDERRPFALAEAWCDGVPVVAARNARFADLDAQGHGTVFYAPDDPLDLTRAIVSVRDTSPASRRLLVERGRAQYRRRFSPKAVHAAYASAYQALVARDDARATVLADVEHPRRLTSF